MIGIAASEYDGQQKTLNIDKYPDSCPFCHRDITPRNLGNAFYQDREVQLVLLCPNRSCQKVFIAYYSLFHKDSTWHLHRSSSGFRKTIELPDAIKEVSPSFVTIYQQSSIAEQEGLSEVCGVGYRKSLEFLVKDYAIRKHPAELDEIKKKFLGSCIKEYVSDQRIKTVAERATWLGNDETHYVRKWGTKDVNDLKALIRITMLWIEMEVETEKIEAEMPPPS